MGVETLVGVNCDRDCKWKAGITCLRQTITLEQSAVPTHEPYAPGDKRPTAEGYAMIDQLEEESTGLRLLETKGEICDARACLIEDTVDNMQGRQFGIRVQELINDLKGE